MEIIEIKYAWTEQFIVINEILYDREFKINVEINVGPIGRKFIKLTTYFFSQYCNSSFLIKFTIAFNVAFT